MGNQAEPIFASFFQAGFECSSHRRRDGVRLDLIRATSHDRHVASDYRQCADLGIRTTRDGLRWHLIEKSPGHYDWSSWMPALEAAELTGLEIIWDLFHYGSPDHVDQHSADFPQRFTNFAMAALEVHQTVSRRPPMVVPLNEINFLAWAVNEGYFPSARCGEEGWFKRHLVRAGVMASRAIKRRWPESTIAWAEPLIHIAPRDHRRQSVREAKQNLQGMYEAYDGIMGLAEPEIGGDPSLVDVVGLNFYPHNQWYFQGPTIPMGHHEYRPLADMLVEMSQRYGKPLLISETGAEGSGRPAWLHYVCDEVRAAQERGAEIRGICIYPVTAYPGWDNSRHCEVGLFGTIGSDGKRQIYRPLQEELQRQRALFGLEDSGDPRSRRLRIAGR